MGTSVTDLTNYLRLEGPCDKDLLLIASEVDTPPPGDESSDEGVVAYKAENPEKEHNENEEEPMDGEDTEEELSEGEEELMDEEDPEEDPSEDEEAPQEEEDLDKDSKEDPVEEGGGAHLRRKSHEET